MTDTHTIIRTTPSQTVAQTLQQQLDYILHQAMQLMSTDAAAIWLVDENTGEPYSARQLGLPEPFVCAGPDPTAGHVRMCLASEGTLSVDISAEMATGHTCPCGQAGLCRAMYAPLTVQGRALGAIGVYSKSTRQFSAEDQRLLRVFVRMAGLAIDRDRLYQEASNQLAELKTLSMASEALNVPTDRRGLLRVILDRAVAILDVDACLLVFVDASGHVSEQHASGFLGATPYDTNAAENLARRLISENRVMATWDISRSSLPVDKGMISAEGFVSAASAPLLYQGQALGVLHLYTREQRGFEERALRLLHTFANQAATAVENARLFEEWVRAETDRRILQQSQQWATMLAELHRAAQALGATLNMERVVDILCREALHFGGAEMLSISMMDTTGKLSQLVRAEGFDEKVVTELRKVQGGRDFADLVLSGETIVVDDVASNLTLPCSPVLNSENIRSCAIFPLTSRGRVIGALTIYHRARHNFEPEIVEGLSLLAHYAGSAIQNSLLYEQELEAQRQKDEFFSLVTHELRSPLTSIRGYAQLMMRRLPPEADEVLRRSAVTVVEQSRRMQELVDNLLDLSRLSLGRFALDKTEVDLANLARQVVESLKVTSAHHTLHLIAPESLMVVCDAQRIHQVLENLIGNAIKYTPGGGPVEVTVTSSTAEAEVSVRDQGIGIGPEHLPHIFERYYQAEMVGGAKAGLGVGLNVCQEIVLAHGGRIWAESEPGKGSTFHFTIPRQDIL
jgi:signal transduction histidine kinase